MHQTKFLDRIAEEPNLSDKNRSAISLPRMTFELTVLNMMFKDNKTNYIEQLRVHQNQMQRDFNTHLHYTI